LTFYSIFLARLSAAMDYICTNFGVDSSRRLPFTTWALQPQQSINACSWSLYPMPWLPSAWDE